MGRAAIFFRSIGWNFNNDIHLEAVGEHAVKLCNLERVPMKNPILIVLMILSLLHEAHDAQAQPGRKDDFCPAAGDSNITNILKETRREFGLPAMAGAIVTSRGIFAAGAVGIRKKATTIPVTLDDMWHLGSNTKAMTAVLAARLVEQGRLQWETTVGEVFPEMASAFSPQLREVTLLHLLSHRSGLPANLNLIAYRRDTAPEERLRAVRQELSQPPESSPGEQYHYSNLGYIIVGAIVEKRTGASWEKNMAALVFDPLNMENVGFGGTGTPGEIDQPWGHTASGDPVPGNGPMMDNPPVMGPAGRVHCTIQDWGKFVIDQLRGIRGQEALLKEASYKILHAPPFRGNYALGWAVMNRGWGGGRVLSHAGSNTMNYSVIWMAPLRDFAILLCTNQGGDTAAKALDAAAGALIQVYSRSRDER